jgi:hypothetical protein
MPPLLSLTHNPESGTILATRIRPRFTPLQCRCSYLALELSF